MHLQITTRHVRMTEPLRRQVERRLDFALCRLWPRVDRVRVRLGDLNGPRGGIDKYCNIEVSVRRNGSPTVVRVQQTDTNLFAAVSRAADRIALAVRRTLGRQSSHRRRLAAA